VMGNARFGRCGPLLWMAVMGNARFGRCGPLLWTVAMANARMRCMLAAAGRFYGRLRWETDAGARGRPLLLRPDLVVLR
jgi:hypothetical protein